MALEKGSEEWQMFGDYFSLCKKHWEIKRTDKYWDDLIKDCDDFCKKYKEIRLSRKMALAFAKSQEERYKENIK